MSESTDLLMALRDVGIGCPQAGDAGDVAVQARLRREVDRPAWLRRRLRLPFGSRSIALIPAVVLVTGATAAAAGTVSLLSASPTTLFENNPQSSFHESVIPSSIRRIDSFRIPGVGTVQYWVATTRQHGLCQAMRLPNRTWGVMGSNLAVDAGDVPGCTPTREQEVVAQGSRTVLLPMAVDERSISLKNPQGEWFGVYYGVVDATNAAGVRNPTNRSTVPLIDGRYFLTVVPLGRSLDGTCTGCENLRAINSAGENVPADYGPRRYRDH